jgi:hypothetical protein
MDQNLLVDDKIEDGALLIRCLERRHFDVTVAYWLKVAEESSWRFCVASSSFDANAPHLAFRALYDALDEIPQCTITPMDLTILSNTDPAARATVALRDRNPSREPKRYHGRRLNAVATAELVIYPRRLPMEVQQLSNGKWQVLITESDNVWLTCDSEEEARAIAAAPILEYEALDGIRSGGAFAAELEKTAAALAKHRMSFGNRFFTRLAENACK